MLRAMAEPVISPPEATLSIPPEHSRRQLETLLEVSEAIAQQRDLRALFHDLSERLHAVVEFDFLTLVLHDAARNVMRLHILETREPYEKPEGMEHPVENHPSGWVWQTQQAFVSDDTETDERYPDFFTRLRAHNVRSVAVVPLTTAQRRLGSLGFGTIAPHHFSDSELRFMMRVASQVAVAVDNALNHESSQAYQQQLARERDRLQVLLEINNLLVTTRDLPEVFRGIVSTIELNSPRLHEPGAAGSDDRAAEDLCAGFSGHGGAKAGDGGAARCIAGGKVLSGGEAAADAGSGNRQVPG